MIQEMVHVELPKKLAVVARASTFAVIKQVWTDVRNSNQTRNKEVQNQNAQVKQVDTNKKSEVACFGIERMEMSNAHLAFLEVQIQNEKTEVVNAPPASLKVQIQNDTVTNQVHNWYSRISDISALEPLLDNIAQNPNPIHKMSSDDSSLLGCCLTV
ncbi:hypothetical protein ACH5RR_002928 [Cinchona calisaya]|uniref:Uncharacterized protein n=1 Tax=Cinchona calisaya TaxID=153742 RepID=A0ABD3ATD5_9GENT